MGYKISNTDILYQDDKEAKMDFARNIRYFRDKMRLSQSELATKIEEITGKKTTYENIKSYENGTNPKVEIISAIAKALNITENELFRGQHISTEENFNIPIYSLTAGCGAAGNIDVNEIEGYCSLSRSVLPINTKIDNLSIVRAVGDSMADYIEDGDLAIIDMVNSRAYAKRDDVYLVEYGGIVQIKKLQFLGENEVILHSYNNRYGENPPMRPSEFGYQIQVLGKVCGRIKIDKGL